MKTYKKLVVLLLTLCLLLSCSTAAFAADYSGDNAEPGIHLNPEDTLTLPNNTIRATLTANWGVRVIFLDWDESELQNVLVPVTETTPGSTYAPEDPTRSGYRFTGWERYDENGDDNVTLNDNGTVTNVTGPGPIVYIATYKGVLAEGQTAGNVTVLNTTNNNSYVGYKILDAEINPSDTSAIIYTIREDSPWIEYVEEYFDLTARRTEDGKIVYQADPKVGFNPKTFVDNLPEGMEPDLEEQVPNRDGIITWEDVPFGYYAITSTLGSWVSVDTNKPNVTVIDKNQTAKLDKYIVEDDGDKIKTNSASFGESVKFDIEMFGGDYNKNELVTYYHITDVLGDGFDYDFTDTENVTVTVKGTQDAGGGNPYEYTLDPVDSLEALEAAKSGYYFNYTEDSRTFEVVVKWATLDEHNNLMPVYEDEFNYLYVTYSATVNNDAVIAGDGNLNTASLTYDVTSGFDPENPPKEEPTPNENTVDPDDPQTTTTYVYALAIEKIDAEDKTKHLPGVKFTTSDFRAAKISDGVYGVIGDNDTTSTAVEYFEVPVSGIIVIKGLGAGEYSFTESEALPGYNRLAEPLVMTVSASAETVNVGETPCAAFRTIENRTGIELPSTGGIGTKLFIAFGMIAMLGAGVFLVTNKRMAKESF